MRGELAGEEVVEERVVRRRRAAVPSCVAQREVDVARVALALVELRHEGDRHALLGGDLLRAVLVDRVVVGRAQRRRRSGS